MSTTDRTRFDGRVALVTGAARGIGESICRVLAERGATVAMADVLPHDQWSNDLTGPHTRHYVDVRSMESCRSLVADVLAAHGRLDHLVNNAGIVRRSMAADMAEHDFTDVVDINLTGTFRMSQAAYSALKESVGSVVHIGSTNGYVAAPNTLSYCVSKAGVLHMARVLALEWAADGIRVNAVGPTIVPTDMTDPIRRNPEYMKDKMASIPMGRMAEAQDVADVVAFLLSRASGMVTGQTVFIDGGATIH